MQLLLERWDELIGTRLTDGSYDIILVTEKGMAIRFSEKDVRPMGRTSMGVMGIRLDEDDKVISMVPYFENTTLLVVTANGFGKRTDLDEYKVQNRGGKGVLTYRVTDRTGLLVGAMSVSDDDDLAYIIRRYDNKNACKRYKHTEPGHPGGYFNAYFRRQ